MKTLFGILGSGLLLGSIFSCGAVVHDRLDTGKIVRDCSGTYVQFEGKGDYLVCNEDILADKEDGAKVSVIYDYTKDCKEKEGKAVCMLFHDNKGMIRIKKLN